MQAPPAGPAAVTDSAVIARVVERMAGAPDERAAAAVCLPRLNTVLGSAAHPERALTNLERFVSAAGDRLTLWRTLAASPRALEMLAILFAGSQFLTEILLRHPEYFDQLLDRRYLTQPKSRTQLVDEGRVNLAGLTGTDARLDELRRFQRRELLRIGAGDLFALLDLPGVTRQLSYLADCLVSLCLEVAAQQTGISPARFAVIGMGKLGGAELNYSSDIDLLFLTDADPGDCRRLGERLIEGLSRVTAEGFLYRVDMRLRPWGRYGPLVSSLAGHAAYMREHARLWERQALLKARLVAGSEAVGDAFLRQAAAIVFDGMGPDVRSDIHAMKQRTEAYLLEHNRVWGEVKLGAGSIRDVEFVTQYLQLAHGATRPEVRSHNTLDALHRLAAAGILAADDYRVLADGYTFLRTIEHYLQMMDYRQTSALPAGREDLLYLARRLGYEGSQADLAFSARFEQYCTAVRRIYQRFLECGDMSGQQPCPVPVPPEDVYEHMARMDPAYGTVFDATEIARHAALAEGLSDDNLVDVDARRLAGGRWRITVVAYDYPGELSLICGLLYVHGASIVDGHAFTYEPIAPAEEPAAVPQADRRRKIVDVFTVEPVPPTNAGHPGTHLNEDTWARYRIDLAELLSLMRDGERRLARGELAKRVAAVVRTSAGTASALYPVDIEIDNDRSERYTVLHIAALDTPGFLYELTNALAIYRIYVARVTVGSVGNRVMDTLYVTDENGQKITAPERQRELRAATVLIKHFTHLLPHSPNPETALIHFREFLGQLFTHPNWPDELASLERHDVLDALARLLGVSDFLWDDFLRMQHANLFPVVRDVGDLPAARTREQLQAMLRAEIAAAPDAAAKREALNAFKDREMFRADMRHILGYSVEFGQFSSELTDLTEVVVEAACQVCDAELRARFGAPLQADGQPARLCICGLGKCGGRELGFASDIELMFIFAGGGNTTGPQVVTTAEYYERLVETFVASIRARREGTFHVDLQLRPYGKNGTMAVALDAFRRYFAPDGEAWAYERQALVKLRPIAGDISLGREIVALRDQYVYQGGPFDVAAMRAMRERQIRHLVSGGTLNTKFSPGGLVDLEYLVQALQINHGASHPPVRETHTGRALDALAAVGVLSPERYILLREALIFLRRLINALRVVRGNARDLTVPATPVQGPGTTADSEEFAFLARRLGYGTELESLRQDLLRHTGNVQELSRTLLSP
jgi:glutamate-ammonia-ligase adenylyltransferase